MNKRSKSQVSRQFSIALLKLPACKKVEPIIMPVSPYPVKRIERMLKCII